MKFADWFKAKYGIEHTVKADIFNKDVVTGMELGWVAKEKFLEDNGIVEPKFKSYENLMLDKLSLQLLSYPKERIEFLEMSLKDMLAHYDREPFERDPLYVTMARNLLKEKE